MNLRSEWRVDNNSVSDMFYTKDETIDSVKSNFDIRRYNSAEGYAVIIGGIEVQVIIQDHANPINESDVDKKLLIPIDFNAYTGDYVIYKGDTWIINSKVNIVDDGYKICQMQFCNYTLCFQSPTGTILSYLCIDTTTKTMGLDESNTITTGNSIHTIKLPFDANTILIDYDRRFFIDDLSVEIPQVFAVSKPNRTEFKYSDKGLIELTMKQDAYNSQTDRKDLGICNYFEPTVIPPTPDTTISTEIVTITSDAIDNNIKLGLIYTFSATFKNELNENIPEVVSVYSLDNLYGGLITLIDNHDGTSTVKVDENAYELLTNQVVLKCEDALNGFSSSVTLTIIGLF